MSLTKTDVKIGSSPSKAAGKIFGETVTSLGGLEAEIMDLVWQTGRPVHGMEVAETSLYHRRGQGREPIAFSTVATTLRRLSEKGLLSVSRSSDGVQSRTPYFTPTVGREEMAARILDHVSRTLLGYPMHTLMLEMNAHPENAATDDALQACLHRLASALEEADAATDPETLSAS